MVDLTLAQNKLMEDEHSCVFVKDGKITMISKEKGITPLLNTLIEDQDSMKDMVLADKVIGKAAALLLVYGRVKAVYAHVIGDCAKRIFEKNSVQFEYNRIVPYIMNIDGTDKCMMEKLVEDIEDPEEAFEVLKSFFAQKSNY